MDLTGGYYDAGDNVKFGLPMAFTVTMMSWSIVEYGKQMAANGELGHALDAVKWGTDYLIKAHPEPYVLYGEVSSNYHVFFVLFNRNLIMFNLYEYLTFFSKLRTKVCIYGT